MQMFFTASTFSPLLVESWTTTTLSGLVIAVTTGVALSVLIEGIKCYNFTHKLAFTLFKSPSASLSIPKRLYESFLHVTEVSLAYILMVFIMSYNIFIIAAVVVGAGFGYFFLRPLFLRRITARLRRRLRALRILYPWRDEGGECGGERADAKSCGAKVEEKETDRLQSCLGNDGEGNEVWIEHSVDGVTEVKMSREVCNPVLQCRQFSVRGKETPV